MLHQNLLQKQQGKILPQQIQLLNLFHLNTIQLEHRLQQELEDNPLLEENTADDEVDQARDGTRSGWPSRSHRGEDQSPD